MIQVELGHTVYLSHEQKKADIHYTIDGSIPSLSAQTTQVLILFAEYHSSSVKASFHWLKIQRRHSIGRNICHMECLIFAFVSNIAP